MHPAYIQFVAKCSSPSICIARATGWAVKIVQVVQVVQVFQVVQVLTVVSLDDIHSENIWFTWSKPSDY